MFVFSCPTPLPTSSNDISKLKTLINIDNFKKSTKSPTKHCNSKRFRVLRNVLQNVLFSSKIYLKAIFYIARGF